MNIYSVIFIGLISALAIIAAGYFFTAIYNNFTAGQKFRLELASRIEGLRLNKMLVKKQININKYLHTLPVHKIENQIRCCAACRETVLCDQILSPDNKLVTNFAFCPNSKDLDKFNNKNINNAGEVACEN